VSLVPLFIFRLRTFFLLERDQRDNIVEEVNQDVSIQGHTDVDSVEIDSEKADDNISAERPVRNRRTPAKFNDCDVLI
jgi:hypothetical protein